ncbi:MAG TPA: 2-phosphosulfolactate phosphatase [Candidatus Limnocylindria bacterium]|nr:2-phosphosulfolactate phosphatase [Candidatus Limnocylindria bacterium]
MRRERVAVRLRPDPAGAPQRPLGPGDCAVVIDVLRATTSLTIALHHGARGVIPFESTGEALACRDREADVLACGEREGRIVPGFDLGNSPFEYTAERVAGKRLAFASTNGSRVMREAGRAGRRLLAAFVNAAAVVDALAGQRDVVILCAGKLVDFCLEDAACAGLLCARLESRGARMRGAGARLARALAPATREEVRALVEGSSHGRYLRSLGPAFARDVASCAELDSIDRAFELGGLEQAISMPRP